MDNNDMKQLEKRIEKLEEKKLEENSDEERVEVEAEEEAEAEAEEEAEAGAGAGAGTEAEAGAEAGREEETIESQIDSSEAELYKPDEPKLNSESNIYKGEHNEKKIFIKDKKTLFIKDEENYNQLKILINFCNTNSNNMNLINFINDDDNENHKKTFINYLQLFNLKINESQIGGAGVKFIKYMRGFFNRFNKGSRKHNFKQAIDNMKENMNKIEIKDEIENNIVYEFINLLNFDEDNNTNTKLTINHENYNEFINYFEEKHGIINYINYTKDIEILFSEEGFITSIFNSNKKKNIYKMIKDFVEKYNKMRLHIFNKYLNIEILDKKEEKEEDKEKEEENKEKEEENKEKEEDKEKEEHLKEEDKEEDLKENKEEEYLEEDKQLDEIYKIYFNSISEKDKDIIKDFSEKVLNIDDYIEKINNYSVKQIEEIDKEIKEYIFLTSNKNQINVTPEKEKEKKEEEVQEEEVKKVLEEASYSDKGGKKYRKTKNKKYKKNRKNTKKRKKRRLSKKNK